MTFRQFDILAGICVACLLAFSIAACVPPSTAKSQTNDKQTVSEPKDTSERFEDIYFGKVGGAYLYVVRDKKTNCEYFVGSNRVSQNISHKCKVAN